MAILLLVFASYAGVFVDTGDLEFDSTPTAVVDEARAALGAERFEDAAQLYAAIAEAGGGPRARLAEAVAWYEAGSVRAARAAVEKSLAKAPKELDALVLLGLCMVDGGQVEGGMAKLEEARGLARAQGRPEAEARALVNLGLAWLDRGEKDKATVAFQQVQAMGADARSLQAASDGLHAVADLGGVEPGVGAKLGKGQTRSARAEAEARRAGATSRRVRLAAELDLAAVDRAEGKLESARTRLEAAIKEAREAGMSREVAIGLANLGLVHSVAGRLPLAADTLLAAARAAGEGGYRVVEVDARCELGLAYLHLGRVSEAGEQQRTAGRLLAGMGYAQGVARQAELGGAVAAVSGDVATANEALANAVSYYTSTGRPLDAARAATTLAAAWEGRDAARADSWSKRAEELFAKGGESLGPAHVSLARGLAAARNKDLDTALGHFARAADQAESTGEHGATVARIAREDAAQAMVALGRDRDLAALAAQQGLTEILAEQQQLQKGDLAYEQGLAAYNAGQFEAARARFAEARAAFEALGEAGYALRARKAAAWAVYNQLVSLPATQSAPRWLQLVEEAAKVDDPELYARAYGASAVAAAKAGQRELEARFTECVRLAGGAGLLDVASRCHGAAAEADGDLDLRADHARQAWALAPADPTAIYALYAVSVDAYNGGRNELALELARLALPHSSGLRESVQQVIDAAQNP